MPGKKDLTANQLTNLVAVFFIGSFSIMGYESIATAQRSVWLVVITAMGPALISAFILSALQQRFPQKNLAEYSEIILGRPLGKLVSLVYFLYFIYFFSIVVSELAIGYTAIYYIRTPMTVFYFSLYFLCFLVGLSGLTTLGRLAELAIPALVLLTLITAVLLAFSPNVDFSKLFPLLTERIGVLVQATYYNIGAVFGNLLIFSMFTPYVKDQIVIPKALVKGVLLSGMLNLLVAVFTLMTFGAERLNYMIYSPTQMLRLISLGGFIERIESIVSMTWLLILFMEGIVAFFAAGLIGQQIFNRKKVNSLWSPILLVSFLINYFLINNQYMEMYLDILLTPYALLLQFIIPILLLLTASLRKLRISQTNC